MANILSSIRIEIAYAAATRQLLTPLQVSLGTTVQQAIELSGILTKFPEIDLAKNKVGIFGKVTTLSEELREGDRVEIYRPLLADPKKIRQQRAAEGKALKKGA